MASPKVKKEPRQRQVTLPKFIKSLKIERGQITIALSNVALHGTLCHGAELAAAVVVVNEKKESRMHIYRVTSRFYTRLRVSHANRGTKTTDHSSITGFWNTACGAVALHPPFLS